MSLLTKSDVAKLVKRSVTTPKLDSNKQQMRDKETKAPLFNTKQVPCSEEDIHHFKVDGKSVHVVTTDAQKLSGTLSAEQFAQLNPTDTKDTGNGKGE
jgi:DNA-binding LytR/AlgR family response regulator